MCQTILFKKERDVSQTSKQTNKQKAKCCGEGEAIRTVHCWWDGNLGKFFQSLVKLNVQIP